MHAFNLVLRGLTTFGTMIFVGILGATFVNSGSKDEMWMFFCGLAVGYKISGLIDASIAYLKRHSS